MQCDKLTNTSAETFEKTQNNIICDGLCHRWDCADESLCNGFFYGINCTIYELYVHPIRICDGFNDCWKTARDEKCQINPDTPTCVSGKGVLTHGHKRKIPLHNFTRCAALTASADNSMFYIDFHESKGMAIKNGFPYCEDYMDQTNCSDPARVALTCEVRGYGRSTISKAMVCGLFRSNLCMDGMDVQCVEFVQTHCTVHKHQLCDGKLDCSAGEDETHPSCSTTTHEKCYRIYQTGTKLPIPDTWLGDGLKDCQDGRDENWGFQCGTGNFKRFVVSSETECQDVFICGDGTSSFTSLDNLCSGISSCGKEKAVCESGRGLESMSTIIHNRKNVKVMSYCVSGVEDLQKKLSPCELQSFNVFEEKLYGVRERTTVLSPVAKTDCSFTFGEAYVYLSCLGKCTNAGCPLKKPVKHDDCLRQFPNRVFTVVNKSHLTFLSRGRSLYSYHNNFFHCENGMYVSYHVEILASIF